MLAQRETVAGVLVLDDASLPKQGRHSVGVARQYCGALGKIANRQSVVTWHWTGAALHWPLAAQLYLPRVWTDDPPRMQRAGVPIEAQRFQEKWRSALALLDGMKPLPTYRANVFDAGYEVVLPLLAKLDRRGIPIWPRCRATWRPSRPRRWRPWREHRLVGPAGTSGSVIRNCGRSRPRRGATACSSSRNAGRRCVCPGDGATVRAMGLWVQATQRRVRFRQPGVHLLVT